MTIVTLPTYFRVALETALKRVSRESVVRKL